MQIFHVDTKQLEEMYTAMVEYEGNTEHAINDVLWNEGGELIQSEIRRLLPRSNRTWHGKKIAASRTHPFKQENENLAVNVKNKRDYGYLYFADDGSNTRRHHGNKQFMLKGAENKSEEIIMRCIVALTNDF